VDKPKTFEEIADILRLHSIGGCEKGEWTNQRKGWTILPERLEEI
jgi:hypothetical protein